MATCISDLLRYGKCNAISCLSLADATGLPERIVRLRINRLRLSGVPIISGNAGYWKTDNPYEIAAFARSMCHRGAEIIRVAEALERAAAEAAGQQMIESW